MSNHLNSLGVHPTTGVIHHRDSAQPLVPRCALGTPLFRLAADDPTAADLTNATWCPPCNVAGLDPQD